MISVMGILMITAMLIYGWLSRKQYNRHAEHHNRVVEKQEGLLQLIKGKKEKDKNENEN